MRERIRRWIAGVALTAAGTLVLWAPTPRLRAQNQPAGTPADLIIVNAKVYTAGSGGAFAEAVAVGGNKIVQVGSKDEVERRRGARTEVIDANGAAVVPGFNDIHTHIISGGLEMDNVNLQGARTLEEVQERIRTFAVAHPDRSWVKGRGWRYEPFPGSQPTRQQLDAAVPDRPAYMRCFDGHSVWVNSKALQLAGITKDTPDPPNSQIVKDPKTGEPTGLIKERLAVALIDKAMPQATEADRRNAVRAAVAEALKYGVTSLTDASGSPADLETYDAVRRAGQLSARIHESMLVAPGFTGKDADRLDAVWKAHPDSPWVKTGMIKMFMDGVIETNTAFMLANYTNIPSPGAPIWSRAEFERTVQMLDRRGWQIMVHAIGDGAIRQTLDGFEQVFARTPAPGRGRRHRIEHIETIDPVDVPRFGALGVIASMHPGGGFVSAAPAAPQPASPALTQGAWFANQGAERAAHGGMWKAIAAGGGRVVFGSDWPVASLDAMGRVTAIVNRRGRPGASDQRLSMTTAIDDYTRESAFASFDEKIKGTIAPGMLADLAVLATDVFEHPPIRREDIAVRATIVDGKVVYRANAQAATAQ